MSSTSIECDITEKYSDYLRDESRKTGSADGIAFPSSEDDVVNIAKAVKGPITLQGARTGITGGAVPASGIILNMSRMNAVLGLKSTGLQETPYSVIVQPGVTLKDLRECIAKKDFSTEFFSDTSLEVLKELKEDSAAYFFPPDPTEDTASIGGMAACNASGARSYKYGPTRRYIHSLNIVAAGGHLLSLRRGAEKAVGRSFTLSSGSLQFSGELPVYEMPKTKNAAGYFARDDMDMLDLFVGAEGTLGIITQIELLLRPAPLHNWAVMAFFPDCESAKRYVDACRALDSEAVAAIEFFDDRAISLLRNQKRQNPAFSYLPDLNDEWQTCVYIELDGAEEASLEEPAMQIADLIESSGGSESATWMATGPSEMERMKMFRHAIPEAVNLTIDAYRRSEPEITKLGTDFAVPAEHLHAMMKLYREDLANAGLDYVIFGHIGNDHLHVNILPETLEQYAQGKDLYLKWAKRAVEIGGTVSAEHGIGKLKVAFLTQMYGEKGIKEMKRVKSIFDPQGIINPGNLFEGHL